MIYKKREKDVAAAAAGVYIVGFATQSFQINVARYR